MADSIDQLTVDRMVNALRGPQAPAQHQTPLPRPDPRGNTFNERLPPQLKYYNYMLQNTMSPEVVPTDPLLSHGDYAANADKSMEYVPSQVAESVFNPSMQMPLSYGAGIHKIYTPNMPMPPPNHDDQIARLIKSLK